MSETERPAHLALERRWPDLFTDLADDQRHAVVQACANSWLSGWEPTREEVAGLIAVIRGGNVEDAIAGALAEALRSD